jgi:hypothetical protein
VSETGLETPPSWNRFRRFRDGRRSYPIPVWNGILDHHREIGPAIWVYLWCLDRITKENSGIGFVLGGIGISSERIARELHDSQRTVRRHLQRLAQKEYISLKRTPCGFAITVANSRKFNVWRKDGTCHQGRTKLPGGLDRTTSPTATFVRSTKEDSAFDSAENKISPPSPLGGLTSRDRRRFFEEMNRLCAARLGASLDEEALIERACVRTGTPIKAAKQWLAATIRVEGDMPDLNKADAEDSISAAAPIPKDRGYYNPARSRQVTDPNARRSNGLSPTGMEAELDRHEVLAQLSSAKAMP